MEAVAQLRRGFARLHARTRLWGVLQLVFVSGIVVALAYAVRDVWPDAWPRVRNASPGDLAISCLLLAVYYLTFAAGWQMLLRVLGVKVSYPVALGAEMASMLAKYIPGGVWTPAARIVAMRRAGYKKTGDAPLILASVLLEAGLSALAGVLVFFASLQLVGVVDAPTWPLLLFLVVVGLLLHPRVFGPLAMRLLQPWGLEADVRLGWGATLGLIAYYCLTWLVGGAALFFLLRAVGGEPSWSSIAFLGGTAAVGAIVAVLSIVAPSGLGVREGSMYGLLLAIVSPPVVLGATVLNRLTITLLEVTLLGVGWLAWRGRRDRSPSGSPASAFQGGSFSEQQAHPEPRE